MARGSFQIGTHKIAPGTRQTVDLPVSVLSDHTPVTLSVHVVHGRKPGPTLFVSAAIHGDEIIGVEITRRLLRLANLKSVRGTLLVIPIVNTFGLHNHSRYLPDRRDLNRSFPGSEKGSLAARLAGLFMKEIVERADIGLDLHSAAAHRINFPQIRVSADSERALELANIFGAPVIMTSNLREGSLRHAANEKGVDVLVFEAGEALRFDELSARAGLAGILRVMHEIGMIGRRGVPKREANPIKTSTSAWVRAPMGGLLRAFKLAGANVTAGESLGMISSPFGDVEVDITANKSGIIVGRTNLPVVNEGDALFHVATVPGKTDVDARIDSIASQLESDPLFDEDEII